MGIGVSGIELNGLLQMKGRLIPISFPCKQTTKVGSGSSVVGIDGQRCAECRLRALLVSGLSQIGPQIVLRVREIRL